MEVERILKINIYMILITAAFSSIASYTLLGILLLMIVLFKETKGIFTNLKGDKPLLILIVLVVLTSVISELWYISIAFAGIFIIKVIFSQAVSMYFNKKDVRIIFIILLILGITVSAIGLLQMILGTIEMPVSWVDSSIYTVSFRVYSTFSNPNVLAGFLNLVIITGLVSSMYHKEKNMRILGILGMILSVIALLFTYSRGGWISLSISLLIASLFDRRFLKYAVAIIVLFLSFDYFCDVGRLVPDNLLKDSSIRYRFEIWIASIKIFFDNILFGIGSGTSWYYVHRYSDVISTTVRHAHNLYLQGLVDVGIIGFSSYSVFFWGIWKRIKRNLFNPSEHGMLNTVSFIFYLSLLNFGFIDVVTSYVQISIYLWFLIGSNKLINEVA